MTPYKRRILIESGNMLPWHSFKRVFWHAHKRRTGAMLRFGQYYWDKIRPMWCAGYSVEMAVGEYIKL